MEIDPTRLGTLELDGAWIPYVDLYDAEFLPTRIKVGADDYAFRQSIIIKGHGAVLPQAISALRAEGKRPVIVERSDRYYVFVTPP